MFGVRTSPASSAVPTTPWAVAVGSLALVVATLVMHARTAGGLGASTDLHLADLWLAVLAPVVGAALYGRSRGSRAGVALLSTASMSVGSFGGAYAVWAAERGGAPGAGVAAWLATWTWVPFFVPPLLLVALLAPGPPARPHRLVRPVVVVLALIAVLSAFAPGPAGPFGAVANPWGIGSAPWLGDAAGVLIGLTAVVLVPGAWLLAIVRWRRAAGDDRWQLGLLTAGQTAFVACFLAPVSAQPWSDVLVAAGHTALLASVAVVSHLRGVTGALRAEREVLARAREEERRRLHRDLHDGVAPELAGLALQLDALAATASDDELARRLRGLQDGLRTAVGEVRRVVDDLRPAGIEALGLLGALRGHAEKFSAGGLVCEVDAGPMAGLPPDVEVAAYRIVVEATTNAARHSGARRCRVHLRTEAGALHVEVADDGRWREPGRRGVGIDSMRARAGDVGGRLELATGAAEGTGAVVRAVLPVGS